MPHHLDRAGWRPGPGCACAMRRPVAAVEIATPAGGTAGRSPARRRPRARSAPAERRADAAQAWSAGAKSGRERIVFHGLTSGDRGRYMTPAPMSEPEHSPLDAEAPPPAVPRHPSRHVRERHPDRRLRAARASPPSPRPSWTRWRRCWSCPDDELADWLTGRAADPGRGGQPDAAPHAGRRPAGMSAATARPAE